MSFALNRYDVTISVSPPNESDVREQLTYFCNPESLVENPGLLKAYITEAVVKLDARIARENGAQFDQRNAGPITELTLEGDLEWNKSQLVDMGLSPAA